MDELVQWLGEQLAADERIARAVRVPHDWHQGPGDDDPEWVGDEMVLMWPPEFHTPYEQDKHWRGLTMEGSELAAHIAEHDPARVLREIDAKRELLRRYEAMAADVLVLTSGVQEILSEYRRVILPSLALPYADRTGYREEWRP